MTKNKSTQDEFEPYRIALNLEKEGQKFFLESARKTSSPLARQTFEFLAAEEDKHIEVITRFYESMTGSGGKAPMDVGESVAEERLEKFLLRLESIKDEYEAAESDKEAYQMALDFENGAEDFYQEKLDEATDPKVRKFYAWLIKEESMHSRLINSCLKFVESPTEWFRKRKGI